MVKAGRLVDVDDVDGYGGAGGILAVGDGNGELKARGTHRIVIQISLCLDNASYIIQMVLLYAFK